MFQCNLGQEGVWTPSRNKKGVETPFPRVPTPQHPCLREIQSCTLSNSGPNIVCREYRLVAIETVSIIFAKHCFKFEQRVPWASAEIFPGGGKVDILLIFFSLLAMQRKRKYTKNVQCYGNSWTQCFLCKKTLHEANIYCSEQGYFKTELAEF